MFKFIDVIAWHSLLFDLSSDRRPNLSTKEEHVCKSADTWLMDSSQMGDLIGEQRDVVFTALAESVEESSAMFDCPSGTFGVSSRMHEEHNGYLVNIPMLSAVHYIVHMHAM